MTGPVTPPELLAQRKRGLWKPDAQGRLLFRPRGLLGSCYVVETADQLARIERYEKRKAMLMVVMVGAIAGSTLSLNHDNTSRGAAIGAVVVILGIVACLLGYSLLAGSRIVRDAAMRPLA